jgi:hypothetical protein
VEPTLTCCNGTYHRYPDGVWRYPWGAEVPGAEDLTVVEALELRGLDASGTGAGPRQFLTDEQLRWATGLCGVDEPLLVDVHGRGRQLVVGLTAPELSVLTMLTVVDISELAGVSKATIDSYRYRGYLPEPQVVKGRTPLWSRPVVDHWLGARPGAGWRTDVYGSRERREPDRRLPITRARATVKAADRRG